MMESASIKTPRLRLVGIGTEALARLIDGDAEGASQIQGAVFSSDFLATVNGAFLTIHLEGLRRRPSSPGWFVRAITRQRDGLIVGHCGFHGDPRDVGRAEIGYTIFTRYRRCGYGAESVRGLLEWAKTQYVSEIVAIISPTNTPSIGLVSKLGFHQSDVRVSGADHEELVFTLSLTE